MALRDQIVLSSDFLIGPEEVVTLQALGVQGANSIAQVSFFDNDLDTESRGIDVVARYSIDSAVGIERLRRDTPRVGPHSLHNLAAKIRVSGVSTPPGFQREIGVKAQGSSRSMSEAGWPAAMASSVALR